MAVLLCVAVDAGTVFGVSPQMTVRELDGSQARTTHTASLHNLPHMPIAPHPVPLLCVPLLSVPLLSVRLLVSARSSNLGFFLSVCLSVCPHLVHSGFQSILFSRCSSSRLFLLCSYLILSNLQHASCLFLSPRCCRSRKNSRLSTFCHILFILLASGC